MTAPMELDGAMHIAAFLAYVNQVVVPILKPGDIVVMDSEKCAAKVAGPVLRDSRFLAPPSTLWR